MKLSSVNYCLLFLLLIVNYSVAQDMTPEAARFYNEGTKLLKAGNTNDAIVKFDSALVIQKDYRIYFQKSLAYKKAGDLDKAKIEIEEAIKLNPDYYGSYSALAGIFFSMKNYQGAITNFEKVISIATDSSVKSSVKENLAVAYTMIGNEAMGKNNDTQAIEYFQKAVENNNYDKAYIMLAKLHAKQGEFDKAIAASENALKYKKSISEGGPYYYMGLAYKGKGDLTKAKEMFNKAKSDDTYKKTAEYELSLLK